jgi:hypothetical protein
MNGAADDDDAVNAHIADVISTYDLYALADGLLMKTHGPAQCGNYEGGEQQRCVLHNPTEHPMLAWPVSFRPDKLGLIERTCEHGWGHPDPDSLDYYVRAGCDYVGVHACDGCCQPTDIEPTQEAA